MSLSIKMNVYNPLDFDVEIDGVRCLLCIEDVCSSSTVDVDVFVSTGSYAPINVPFTFSLS